MRSGYDAYFKETARLRDKTEAETGLQSSLSNAFHAANQIEDSVIRGKVLESISQAQTFATQLKGLSQ